MRMVVALIAIAACREAPLRPDLGPPPARRVDAVPAGPATGDDGINPRLLRRFRPVAPLLEAGPASRAELDLGRMLFFEKRLSGARDVSCNSCHPLDRYGVDHRPVSIGHAGQRGQRNAPTVYQAAGHIAQFWDGRAIDVEHQAGQPILDPAEMAAHDPGQVVATLKAIPGYADAFARAFPGDREPITYDHIGAALGAFERGLVTPARWDRYLAGDHAALTADELEGFRRFADTGCVECHTGELVGGSMFRKLGVVAPWPDQRDAGRLKITGAEVDRMSFKVPSLRNVTRTAPYFHDGSVTSLDRAVRLMGHHQIGVELDDEDVRLIVAWLDTLTGELPAAYIAEPVLPPGVPHPAPR